MTLLLSAGPERGWAIPTLFGWEVDARLPTLMAALGLLASFHALIYAYSRRIYSLSRSGYVPRWLSLTSRGASTPHLALILGAVIGFAVALCFEYGERWFGTDVPVAATLLNMAVFGAVISYIMQMLAFVRLRPALSRAAPALPQSPGQRRGSGGGADCRRHPGLTVH